MERENAKINTNGDETIKGGAKISQLIKVEVEEVNENGGMQNECGKNK